MQTYKSLYFIGAIVLPLLLLSCNGQSNETEQALTEYRDYISEFEQDSLSETELRALQQSENDSTAWATEKKNLQEVYDRRRDRLEKSMDNLSPEQRDEADQLEQRYNNALEKREQTYKDASHRYKLRHQLLGMEIQEDDMSDVTVENIGETYQRFVSELGKDAEKYEERDWNLVEGWWNALNSRYRAVEGELQTATKKTVQEAQQKYREIHAKTGVPQPEDEA
ncbi:hypothetical protein [Pontibacter mangrovi]|uniref:DUF3826 domain-containing protein n=1 Tax=Pontibacter mangrovi TaxID=2589816 RepID=A0A501VZV3_9BACT|nr:hypothetical protein [Pontibacter mangrovi]TPE43253.1 hypothetical protein FJM65_14160 [Pontibacter mangrovi]